MISPGQQLLSAFIQSGVTRFCGVPDSVLADFSMSLEKNRDIIEHTICANEGNAIAFAMGIFMATDYPALVYFQNSGLGNAFNPLVSMASPRVASIPIVLLIGWRGEPGRPDEPQHLHQGEITLPLLKLLDIPYLVVSQNEQINAYVEHSIKEALDKHRPVAIVVSPSMMPKPEVVQPTSNALSRRIVIEKIVDSAPRNTVFVATTGYASRELDEVLAKRGQRGDNAFLLVGAMGHASQVALAVAANSRNRHVVCIDGDGSALMHLGGFSTIVQHRDSKLIHILVNNQCHDSVGGQPLVNKEIDFCKLAEAFGYRNILSVSNEVALQSAINRLFQTASFFLEVHVSAGLTASLSRPRLQPLENARRFQRFLCSDPD